MATATSEVGAFPSPFSIETPAGCEGWEEMYPYWSLFDENRREADENRLWFWNSMHFPLPMPAFDIVETDHPYAAFAGWQNRAFAVPPVMGVDYRIVNGYVYISPNPVTDPELIGQRAEIFQKRAGYYFSNWDELYVKWREKMEALNREVEAIEVPSLDQYEDEDVLHTDRKLSNIELLDAYRHALHCAELMWQHHFEFLLLGYGAYLTFAEFCREQLPDIPDQHISQMVAGVDVDLFKPDEELRRLARLAIETDVAGAFQEGRTPDEIDAELGKSDAGKSWLWRRSRTPGSTWEPATGSTTTSAAGTTTRASPTRRSSGTSPRSRRARRSTGRRRRS
jgi:pyruvate,water dikinase